MRTLLILFALVSVTAYSQEDLALATTKKLKKITYLSDEDQIKSVIIKETETYSAGDADGWRSCFTQSPKTAYVYRWPDGETGQIVGFEQLNAMMTESMNAEQVSNYKTLGRSDWNIKIKGDMAWVTYKEKASIDGKEYSIEEIRVLEKINGAWKLDMIGYIF